MYGTFIIVIDNNPDRAKVLAEYVKKYCKPLSPIKTNNPLNYGKSQAPRQNPSS